MKQPSWKTPLILSTTLAAVGSFAYWLQYSHKPKQEKVDSAQKKPLSLASDDTQIAAFKIKSAAGLIEVKCNELAQKNCKVTSDGQWSVSYPAAYPADSENVKSFLNDAANVLATEVIDLAEETPEKRTKLLEEYGLSPDKRTDLTTQFIEFVTEDGKRITAWFGLEHPLGDKTFVARSENGVIDDKKIYLITNFFKGNFDKRVTHFRDKKLFHFNRSNITAFEAKTTASKLSATLEQGKWTINGFNGDYERIETALSAISQLKATEFFDASYLKGLKPIVTYAMKEKEKNYTLDLYVKVIKTNQTLPSYEHDEDDGHNHGDDAEREPGSQKSKSGKVGSSREEKHFYAVSSELKEIAEVPPMIRSQIDKSLSEFRNGLLISSTDKVSLHHFKVEGKNFSTPAIFEFKGGAWTTKSNMDSNSVPKLFDILAASRVSEFVPIPKGTRSEEIVLSMGDDQNPTKFRYQFFMIKSGKTENVYAIDLNSKTQEALALEAQIYKNALPFTPDSWKMKP